MPHRLVRWSAALVVVLAAACGPDPAELEPLLGTWRTSDPRWEECALVFSVGAVLVLERADGQREVGHVLSVERETHENETRFHLEYETEEDSEVALDLLLTAEGLRSVGQAAPLWERERS